ncbi:MAG: metallophosphoesterase family protein [Sandaracinobacteroides sp.]
MTRLFHISDLHFGREDKAALAWFAGEVARQRPDAILLTGDLTQSARSREFAQAAAWLAALETPIAMTPGNHDLLWHNPIERALFPYRRFRAVAAPFAVLPPLEDVHIVLLQTTARMQLRMNWAEGIALPRRVERAVGLLAKKPPAALSLVLSHHPLIDRTDMRVPGRTAGGRAALERLSRAGADAVLTGHVHDSFDSSHCIAGRTIRLIGAGTLSERVRATRPSFNSLEVADGRLAVEHLLMP